MKQYLQPFFSSPPLALALPRCGEGSISAWTKTAPSSNLGGRSSEGGFLLVFTIPLLLLALAFLAGTVRMVTLSQERIALQARLDLCALRLLETRKAFAQELVSGNRVLRATGLAIAMARGLQILGGPAGKLVGSLGEAALLRLNQATAQWQELRKIAFQAREALQQNCAKTPFSKSAAFCRASPFLSSSLHRPPSFFPDVKGPLEFRQSPLVNVHCLGRKGLNTKMALEGDPTLLAPNFSDHYEQ